MEFRTFGLEGLLELIPRKIEDERGYFQESFRLNTFTERAGPITLVQENQSLSIREGTIRGIHFQSHPQAQGKLVRCVAGELLDVAVDLRHGSPTFGQCVSLVLCPEKNNQFWIPVGFGHAFCTLKPNTIVSYRVTNYYSPEHDKGVVWNDPDVAIEWPDIADPSTLSPKDRALPALNELPTYFSVKD